MRCLPIIECAGLSELRGAAAHVPAVDHEESKGSRQMLCLDPKSNDDCPVGLTAASHGASVGQSNRKLALFMDYAGTSGRAVTRVTIQHKHQASESNCSEVLET